MVDGEITAGEGVEGERWSDRVHAGTRLGVAVRARLGADESALVIGLPRGGVIVGAEVARALVAPLDVWLVRKIGVPGQEELGLGAIAEGGYVTYSNDIVRGSGISRERLMRLTRKKAVELERRTRLLRGDRLPPVITDRTVILVDDGIATGGTVRAAAEALRSQKPRRLVLAVPVVAADTLALLAPLFDETIALAIPQTLRAVGLWYDDFGQVDDDEVMERLAAART